ncbi:hypothetical protein C8J57DRAFT_1622198 [Mycena rebaudengoi]|nr:hypothetical protein C8J57DRAFT_1622198 [Mycena rebaudengoi]
MFWRGVEQYKRKDGKRSEAKVWQCPAYISFSCAINFTLIDDRDLKITYTGTWNLGGTPNEHNGTVSSSIKVGNHFSVPFSGTAIGVYGTFDSSSAGVKTSYEIDGGPTTTIDSPSSGKDSFQQLFWQSDSVGPGPHTLVVSMVAVNSKAGGGEGTVWFDYFNVTHAPRAEPPSPRKTSHAALIGGVVAGVAVLIVAAGLLLLYLRRRRRKLNAPSETFITPLPAPMSESRAPPAASSGKHTGHLNTSSGVSESAPSGPLDSSAQSSYGPSESAGSSSSAAGITPDPSSSIAELKRRQCEVISSYEAGVDWRNSAHLPSAPVQHVDSGIRELTPDSTPAVAAELPPVYTAT